MERIASKTKIVQWAVMGEKEKIEFDLCDFSPEQVAALERLVRHPDDKVRATIAVEQKKLQIADITSGVRIVSIALRAGGQKIKLADFHSPDERATSLKRLSTNETPVTLTIEAIQGELPFASPTAEAEPEAEVTETLTISDFEEAPFDPLHGDHAEVIEIPCAKTWNATASILVCRILGKSGAWRANAEGEIDGEITREDFDGGDESWSRSQAIAAAARHLRQWLNGHREWPYRNKMLKRLDAALRSAKPAATS